VRIRRGRQPSRDADPGASLWDPLDVVFLPAGPVMTVMAWARWNRWRRRRDPRRRLEPLAGLPHRGARPGRRRALWSELRDDLLSTPEFERGDLAVVDHAFAGAALTTRRVGSRTPTGVPLAAS
jgi:hypothetical protein